MGLINELKQYYLARRMTQQELAKKLKVSFITVNRWLNGRTKPSARQEYQIKLLIASKYYPEGKNNDNPINMVKSEDKAYYGKDNHFVEQIKYITDTKTGEEEVFISYISSKRTIEKITISGKELVKLIEKYKK